ncbi:MAG: sigma-70 family RNA polymerase sigma factor [Phycisphaerae bacterium]
MAAPPVNGDSLQADRDESGLVERAKRGDAGAAAALIERYQDRVYNTCFRMCRNHADALDMAQTVFVKVLEALPRFETRSSFYTWLFRIAVNVVLSERRRRRVRGAQSLDASPESDIPPPARGADDDARPSRSAELSELRTQLEAALARLDDEFRIAVVLKDVEGMDYAAIAAILNVPVGTVKSRIHRGRQMLREFLGSEEVKRDSAAV